MATTYSLLSRRSCATTVAPHLHNSKPHCVKVCASAATKDAAASAPRVTTPSNNGFGGFGSTERVLDVSSMLQEFDPLKGGHLMQWDSDDESTDSPNNSWEAQLEGYSVLQPTTAPWGEYEPAPIELTPEELQLLDGEQPLSQAAMLLLNAEQAGSTPSSKPAPSPLSDSANAAPLPSSYSSEGGFKEISAHELAERLATGEVSLLLDVRTEAEYSTGHVTGATNLPLDSLSPVVKAGELDEFRRKPVVVICASGNRSSQALVRLTKVLGFSNVTNAQGGMQAWVKEGLPVEQPIGGVMPLAASSCGCGKPAGGCGSSGKGSA